MVAQSPSAPPPDAQLGFVQQGKEVFMSKSQLAGERGHEQDACLLTAASLSLMP
jgi:hypothetical protein